jgi:hypothetical protein
MTRFLAVAVAVLALATAAGAAGPSPQGVKWADGVCSAAATWKKALSSAGSAVTKGGVSKSSLQKAADQAKTATQTFASSLKKLGKPNTPNGQKAKKELDQLASSLSTTAGSLSESVSSVSNLRGALKAAGSVASSLADMGRQLSSSFDDLRAIGGKSDVKGAFQQASSCKAL